MSRRLAMIFLAVAGLAAGIYFMPRVNPSFAGIPQIGRDQVSRLVQEFLQQRKFDPSGFHCDKVFIHDGTALDYLIDEFGLERVIALGRQDQFPLLYWQYEFYRNAPKDAQRETFNVRVSPQGKLLGFFHVLPDSAAGDSLSEERALQIARQRLESWPGVQFAKFDLEQSAIIKKTSRKDHKLIFTRRDASLGEASELIEIYIAGAELAGLLHKVRVPDRFLAASGIVGGANVLINTFSVVVYVVLLFASLIAFLRKYHEGEIGVRIGLWLGGIAFFALTLAGINMWERIGFGWSFGPISQLYNKLIVMGQQVFFGYVFISLMVLGCWTVGEQAVRADKARLLSGVDSLFHRRWLTKNIGRELPVGFAFGLMLFGLVQLVMYLMIKFFGVLPRLTDNSAGGFDSYVPLYGIVVTIIMAALFDELVFRLFLIAPLRRRLKSTAVAAAIAAGLYGMFLIFFNDAYGLRPSYASLLPAVIFGLIQSFVFWRYGLLASMSSSAVFYAMVYILPLMESRAPFFMGNGIAGAALLVAGLAVGLVGAWRGKEFDFTPEDEPAHIRRIKERTRLQKELEIARRVQLGLLPKTHPSITGFDIAGACLPALEVGGDYFDYVHLPDERIGIAIGDVSGKGVPAAIYMTLTKGILQSHAEESLSPKQVLSKVNHLMYRTIERSWYVSMFYAVLDSRRRVLRFARAGHNPAIVLHTGEHETKLLKTAGIGLGLEVGEIFTRTLVEGELPLASGDTLIFYTDGFTEAMNSDLEEFGDQRFVDLLRQRSNGSARDLLQTAFDEVKAFAGDHPQHDDMTMVVLKVRE